MKKAPKIFLIVSGLLFAILLVFFVSLRIYFTPEKLGALTVSFIEKHVKRKVKVKSVSIGLGHLAIEGFAVSEESDFSKGEMFRVDDVRVWFEPLKMIVGEFVIRTIDAGNAEFTLRKSEDGKLNTSDLLITSNPSKADADASDADKKSSLMIRNINFSGAVFHYVDEPSKTDLLIDGIDLSARGISLSEPFNVETSFVLHYTSLGKKFILPVELNGELSLSEFDWKEMSAKVELLQIASGKMTARISGSIANFTQPMGTISIDTNKANSLELEQMLSGIPSDIILPPLSVASKYRFGDSSLNLEETKISTDGLELVAAESMSWRKGEGFRLDVDLQSLDVALGRITVFTPSLARRKLQGNISGSAKIGYADGRFANSGKFFLKGCGLSWDLYAFSGIDSDIILSKSGMDANHIKGKLNGSPFTSSLSFVYSPTSTTTNLAIDIQELDLTGVKVQGGKKKVTEKVRDGRPMNFKARVGIKKVNHDDFTGNDVTIFADIKNYTKSMKRMGGTASFAIHNGRIKSMNKGEHRNKVVEVLMLPLMVVQKIAHILTAGIIPDFEHITYKIIEGNYTFTDGLMKIVKSNMDTSAAYVRVEGNVDLPPEKLDMKIRVSPKGVVGILQAPEFDVTGTIPEPKVHYDPASIPTSLIKTPVRLLEKVFH